MHREERRGAIVSSGPQATALSISLPRRSHLRTDWSAICPRSAFAPPLTAGCEPTGLAGGGVLHLINSGPAALDGTGQQSVDGKPAIKPFWEITPGEVEKCLDVTAWHAGIVEYFGGGGWSTSFRARGGTPVTMSRINLIKVLGPALQIAEGYTTELPGEVH